MSDHVLNRHAAPICLAAAIALAASALIYTPASAQQPAPTPAAAGRATAPVDLTGYWVSVVTEDWRWRMVTPAKGDFASVPLNAAGQKAAAAWDYAKDMAAGNQCKAYGAGGLMRMPTRVHITWQDDRTMKLESDAGQQTRLFRFDKARPGVAAARTLQGTSAAEWVDVLGTGTMLVGRGVVVDRGGDGGGEGGRGRGRGNAPSFGGGGLKVVTTNVRAGYVRKNGLPYSENAIVTEHFDRVPGPNGTQWLIVQTIVDDPAYFSRAYVTSAHFKLEPDGSKWHPTPCEVDPPLTPPQPEDPPR